MEGLNTALLSGCKEERWPLVARVHMLHLLELRSLGWRPSTHTHPSTTGEASIWYCCYLKYLFFLVFFSYLLWL